MDMLRETLQQVKAGRRSFGPVSDDESDMRDFQVVAKALKFAEEQGLLDQCCLDKENYTGRDWYVRVLIPCGLSHKGEQFLADGHTRDSGGGEEEVVLLKPHFHGIGLDLKSMWRRWRRWRDRKGQKRSGA